MEDSDISVSLARPASGSSQRSNQPFIFHIPIEIRNTIYRFIAVSRLDCHSHPRLWRPLGVDGGIHRIGYFDQDTVIPLLLTNRQFHDEVAAILYGENTFAFHISGLSEGPIWFLEKLAPRYIRLLRKVYIRTGHHVDTYGFRLEGIGKQYDSDQLVGPSEQARAARDLAISVALIKQAWPKRYRVIVSKKTTVTYSSDEFSNISQMSYASGWPASFYHLWKMFVIEENVPEPEFEFRRIEWGGPSVKNLRYDGVRVTLP